MYPHDDWDLWIRASIIKHFSTYFVSKKLYLPDTNPDFNSQNSWYQLRLPNISFYEASKDVIEITQNIELTIATSLNQNNIYQRQLDINFGRKVFTIIPIYKLVGGDSSFVGNLELLPIRRGQEPLQQKEFGLVNRDIKFYQTIIYARYNVTLT